jgi:hypothetical protein
MGEHIVNEAVSSYFEYGVLGITVVVLFVVSSILLKALLNDKNTNKQYAEALKESAENYKEFVLIYKESQKRHEEIINILNETLKIERENSKSCYIDVTRKLETIHQVLGRHVGA